MQYAVARLAVHTEEQLLHPAALLEFRARFVSWLRPVRHMRRRCFEDLCWRCSTIPRLQQDCFHPFAPYPASRWTARDAAEAVVDFGFRSQGHMPGALLVVQPPAQAWSNYNHGGNEWLSYPAFGRVFGRRICCRTTPIACFATCRGRFMLGELVWRDWHQEGACFLLGGWSPGSPGASTPGPVDAAGGR